MMDKTNTIQFLTLLAEVASVLDSAPSLSNTEVRFKTLAVAK